MPDPNRDRRMSKHYRAISTWYAGVASAKISWLHQYARCQWRRAGGGGGGGRTSCHPQAVALSHRSCEAEIKLSANRASWPTLVSKSSSVPASPSCPSLSLSLLSFQSDCFRGCLCVPQIGFLLCRTALRIEFELIPLTRPADLRALT